MPAPKDLTGCIFGQLEVIRAVGKRSDMSKSNTIWLCHCNQCGRDEEIVQLLLPYCASAAKRRGARYSCSICSRGSCVICGGENIDGIYQGVCSEACYLDRRRQHFREFHYRHLAENPNYWNDQYKQKQAKIAAEPQLLEKQRQQQAERSARRRETDKERLNAIARKNYWQNRDQRLARRRELMAQMTAEDQLLKELQDQQRQREYWDKNRETILQKRQKKSESLTPEQIEARRTRARELYRQKKQQRLLDELMKMGEQLVKRSHNDE